MMPPRELNALVPPRVLHHPLPTAAAYKKCWAEARGRNCGARLAVHFFGYEHLRQSLGLYPIEFPENSSEYATSVGADEACLVISRVSTAQLSTRRRRVLIDLGDVDKSRRNLGNCTLVAKSHAEQGPGSTFVSDWDISLPLAHGHATHRIGAPPLAALEALARVPAHRRPYWLTFKGQVYPNGRADRPERLLLQRLEAADSPARRVVVAMRCQRWKPPWRPNWTSHELQQFTRFDCDARDRTYARSPPYLSLLNTTFALVPGGMQPASYRLSEAMAAGAIPIVVSGDAYGRTYLLPFAEVVPWSRLSYSLRWEQLGSLVERLARLESAEVARMQQAVRLAWRDHLRPGAATRTLFTLLRRRLASAMAS